MSKTLAEIGIANDKLYFIADIAANHDGDLNRALRLIELAKDAGADAAKFQNFQAAKIVSDVGFRNMGGKLSHQAAWKKSVYEVYEDASISSDWTAILKEKCDEVGIHYFTSPYDFESVDQVDPYLDIYKVGSGDITWIEILEYIAGKNKPVIIASGASTMDDVERAMSVLQKQTDQLVLMQCNTNYTASTENFKYIQLNVLKTYAEKYPGIILGLSDHTHGHATVLGSIALGARVFEKHFTDDNHREGPDHKFAMNPSTWRDMVDRSYELFYALGNGVKKIEDNEKQSALVQRRSIRVNRNLKIGEIINREYLEYLRPCPEDGLPPYMWSTLIGKTVTKNINKGEHLTKEHFV
ncbi:MAG: N-acetylneuraminate synthase [Bacteroidetes bacterium]|nr:N-acetylneuraminate synthase [Bacteroidota bacterium]